jgi:adenylate cyclase
VADSDLLEQEHNKPAPVGLLNRIRARLTPVGGALASIAAVGAVAGGLVGYWNVWKTVRTDVFPERQKIQREARARPDIVPRLSLVVLRPIQAKVRSTIHRLGRTTNALA